MLPKKFRLPGYRLPAVLGGQTVVADGHLVIRALPNQLRRGRLAVVISGRFLSLATRRNRLRRRLLALIDPAKIAPGFDIVVLVKR